MKHLERCRREDTGQHEASRYSNNSRAYVISTPVITMRTAAENIKVNNIARGLVYESGNLTC